MADKSPVRIIKDLSRLDRNSFDDYLQQFKWGDQNYDAERQKAYDYLVAQGVDSDIANQIIDANVTKRSHLQTKRNLPLLSKKVGIFATNNDWNAAQQRAMEMYANSKEKPFGVAYGFRHNNDSKNNYHKNDGLAVPFALKTLEELDDIRNSLKTDRGQENFTLDVYYGN